MGGLTDRKVVILGASSGIGRAVAIHSVAAGASTLLCGRRKDRLEEVQAVAGAGTVLLVDLAQGADVERLGEEVARYGPVDAVVSTVGTAPLKLIKDTSDEDWVALLKTNVIGINSAIRAMLPSLADGAVVLALSSEAVTDPRWALTPYGASKAALETSIAGWRLEYPRLRFGIVGVGSTLPSDFARDFNMDLLGTAMEVWVRHGQTVGAVMDSHEVGHVLVDVLAAVLPYPGVNMEHMVLRTPSGVTEGPDLTSSDALG